VGCVARARWAQRIGTRQRAREGAVRGEQEGKEGRGPGLRRRRLREEGRGKREGGRGKGAGAAKKHTGSVLRL